MKIETKIRLAYLSLVLSIVLFIAIIIFFMACMPNNHETVTTTLMFCVFLIGSSFAALLWFIADQQVGIKNER